MRIPYLISLVYIFAFLNPYLSHAAGEGKPLPDGTFEWRGQIVPGPFSGGRGVNPGAGINPYGGGPFGGNAYYGNAVPTHTAPVRTAPVQSYVSAPRAVSPPAPNPEQVRIETCANVTQSLAAHTPAYQGILQRSNAVDAITVFEQAEVTTRPIVQQAGRCRANIASFSRTRDAAIAYLNERFPRWNTAKQHTTARYAQIQDTGRNIDNRLQEVAVTGRLNATLINHIRVQRTNLQVMASDARAIVAQSNAYYQTAMMVADYAYFSITATHNFLGGVAMGVYDTAAGAIASVQRISEIIYADPASAGVIAERIVHAMMRPEVIAESIRGSFRSYSQALAAGDYHLAGKYFSFTVMQIIPLVQPALNVGNAAGLAARQATNRLIIHLGHNPAAQEAAAQSIFNTMAANERVAAEWGAVHRELGINSPVNPGRLSEIAIDRERPILHGDQNAVASTFRSATYRVEILKEPLVLTRWQQRGNRLGNYFSPEKRPQIQAIIDHAIAARWQESVTDGMANLTLHEVEIPAGTTLYRGPAAPVGGVVGPEFAPKIDAALVGGGEQIYVEDLRHATILRSE